MAETTLEQLQAEPQTTPDARLNVAVSTEEPLQPGVHTFELVVTDNAGLTSQPATVTIVVRDTTAPTAVLRVLGPNGRILPRDDNGNFILELGSSLILDGRSSSDPGGGQVARYTWRLVPQG